MACTDDTATIALDTVAGVLKADVKISATAGNRASAQPDGVFVAGDFIETGDYVWSGRATKTSFLLCDGAEYSRSTYATLFAQIGTTYGAGDGSTTFNVPDSQGRLLVSKGTHASVTALGATEGVVAAANRTPKHNSTLAVALATSVNWIGAGSNTRTGISYVETFTGGHDIGTMPITVSGSVGPGGTLPVDTPAFLVANLFIKT